MKIYDFSNYENFYAIGDIHGDFDFIMMRLEQRFNQNVVRKSAIPMKYRVSYTINANGNLISSEIPWEEPSLDIEEDDKKEKTFEQKDNKFKNSLYIVVGDVGLGFSKDTYYNEVFTEFNKLLADNNSHLLLLRGNHDDPSYFLEEKINFSNIKSIPDYSIIKLKEHNALCVGGGISIDRTWRTSKESVVNKYVKDGGNLKKLYWENENIVYNEDELRQVLESGIKIDILLTHIPPIKKDILGNQSILNNWLECDEHLAEDLKAETKAVNSLFNFVKDNYNLSLCCWSHMHNTFYFKEKDIMCYQLNVNEIINISELFASENNGDSIFKTIKPKSKWTKYGGNSGICQLDDTISLI